MENVNKQLLDALKSVTLSEEDIELERSVAPEEYDKARNVISKADAMIVKELKGIEESCDHKNPELFTMIQEYGAAEHSQNDGLAIHLLSKIKEAIAAAEQAQQACRDCNGTGDRDSGGVHPWGEAIMVPCDCQAQQQAEPVARNVLMQVAEMVRDECASAWCDRANKKFEVDITSIVERYATTASQARAIINEQAEKLAKGRQQWEKVSQPPAVAVPDGWDAESVRLAFSTLRYIIGLKPDGIKAPFDHVQDIIEKVASWSDMGPCHPVRKQYEAAAAHRAMLAAAPQAATECCGACSDGCKGQGCRLERESPPVVAQSVAHPCWSCGRLVTAERRAAADGDCPNCGAELDLEDWPAAAQKGGLQND